MPGPQPSGLSAAVRERTILVVDDDRHSREGLRDVLTHGGYAVETAADGWQALVRIRAHAFDIAVIELDLPPVHGVSVSGWDLARIFRTYSPGIAIIVVGAESDATLKRRADLLGVAAFLEKPISPMQVKAIAKAFESVR